MQSVISVFDDFATARRAFERLLDAGFAPADVHIARGDQPDLAFGRVTTEAAAAQERAAEGDRGVLSSIGHFMSSILGVGTAESQARTYTEAVLRGSSLVLVDVNEPAQSELACSIMRELGAVDVDTHGYEWRSPASGATPAIGKTGP